VAALFVVEVIGLKCDGCVWCDITMRDGRGKPIQVYCLPHEGGCPKGVIDDNNQDDSASDKK